MGFYATVFWNDYSWNDFSEILKLKQKIDIETITIFMKHRPGPLQTNQTTHQDQYLYGGELSGYAHSHDLVLLTKGEISWICASNQKSVHKYLIDKPMGNFSDSGATIWSLKS